MEIYDAQQEYNRQLRRLYDATRWLNSPERLALIINKRLIEIQDGALVRNIIQTRFATGGTSGGFSWSPLSTATQTQRTAQGFSPSGPILIRSGFLVRAAVDGELTATSDQIIMMFKDGPAPRYIGKGKAVRQKIHKGAAIAQQMARALGAETSAKSNRLSDYATALNTARPFYGRPNAAELEPLFEKRNQLIAAAMTAIANGQNMYQAIQSVD